MFKEQEKRVAFMENVFAQAVGTALGGGLLFIVGSVAGVFADISLGAVMLGLVVLGVGLALLAPAVLAAMVPAEAVLKRRVVKEAEERLRDMTGEERMRWFVPHPGGFAKPPWILEKMKEPLRAQVDESLRKQAAREGREGPTDEGRSPSV